MSCRPHQKQNDGPGSSTRRGNSDHPPLFLCEPLAGLICLPRGDDREPRREGRRFSSSTHEMRQPDAANRLERWSVGCGLFESRRRSLGAMGLGEPLVSHQAAAAETDQSAIVGVKVGDCYRRADTSSRDKPQPTQTVPAPLHWSRATIEACQGKRRHDPVGAVGWRRLAAMCRL